MLACSWSRGHDRDRGCHHESAHASGSLHVLLQHGRVRGHVLERDRGDRDRDAPQVPSPVPSAAQVTLP